MTDVRWHRFENSPPMIAAARDAVAAIIADALSSRGLATLALPGGNTPVPVFRQLAATGLDWSKVIVMPTDDRLVASENPLCNSTMLRDIFEPCGARLIPFNVDTSDVIAAANQVNTRLAGVAFPLDLVWIGVGTDGHTASILAGPDVEKAFQAPDWRRIVGVTPDPLPPEAPIARVTMTRAALTETRALMIVMSGEEKRLKVEQGLAEKALSRLPIGRVLADAPLPVDIYWCP